MRIACDVSATQLDDMFEMIDLLNDIVIKPCLYTRTVNCPLTTQERFHVVNAFSVEGIQISRTHQPSYAREQILRKITTYASITNGMSKFAWQAHALFERLR